MTRAWKIYALIAGIALGWCALLLLAPLTAAKGIFPAATEAFYRSFHQICHQLDSHSFHLLGKPLLVCARCSSIYFGFLAGTFLYPIIAKPFSHEIANPKRFLALAAAPMICDALAQCLGLYHVPYLSRIITGAIFGIALPFLIIPLAIKTGVSLSATHKQGGSLHGQPTG